MLSRVVKGSVVCHSQGECCIPKTKKRMVWVFPTNAYHGLFRSLVHIPVKA